MTKAEVARLLTLIAAFDRRTIGETDVEAWHLILGHLDPADCAEAVREHFTASTDWLMPAHVHRLATAAARRRVGRQKLADREAQIAAENPALDTSDTGRPLRALMAGGPLKPVPKVGRWPQRPVPVSSKPPFADEELAAAKAALEQVAHAPSATDATPTGATGGAQ